MYISHEDYKGFMNKFQAKTPKGKLIKEGRYNDEDAEFVEMISDELVKLFKAGKISNDQWNDADDYLGDHGYELWVDAQTGSDALDTILQHVGANVKEGNAFTAGLAKAKKGQEFKVGGKTVKDTSNYDAPIKEADDDIQKLKQEIETEYGHGGSILSFANPHELARIAKISPKAAKALESLNNMMPEDLDIADLKPALKTKAEKIESTILKDLGIDLEELDEASYTDNYEGSWGYREGKEGNVGEGLNMPPLQATGQTISTVEEEYTADRPFKIPSKRNSAELDYDPQASRFEPDYMKTPGEDDDDDEDNIGIDDDDDLMNLPNIPKNLKQAVAKDKARYPFLREDQAPYGFSVLSPDERKQLREYINSVKTIKQEIAKLLEKAGKSGKIMEDDRKEEDEKVPAERKPVYNNPTKKSKPGGNRTGLVMTKAEMYENEEHSSIESSLGSKLHDAFNKVTDMAIKQLMADGFDESMAASFLKSEIEERAKEAIMSQYDL